MKAGVRALGVAESYTGQASTVAGAVVRADRAADGFVFGRWTVGGTDATETVLDLLDRLDRPDVRYLVCAGIAPAWFNVLDLHRLHAATGLPTLSVSFEESPGLADAIRREFDGEDCQRRLATYYAQPDREPVEVDGETCWVRAVGCDEPAAVVRAFTHEGGRPEPVRVARLAARAADALDADGTDADGTEGDADAPRDEGGGS